VLCLRRLCDIAPTLSGRVSTQEHRCGRPETARINTPLEQSVVVQLECPTNALLTLLPDLLKPLQVELELIVGLRLLKRTHGRLQE
ncbi:hypothetical protein, partial [Clostridioides difficile]